MPWYPPTRLDEEAAAQLLASILEAQQRYEALAGGDDADSGGGPSGLPPPGSALGQPAGSGPPPGRQTCLGDDESAPYAFIGFEYQLPAPPPGMYWVEMMHGTYIAMPAAGPAPVQIPVPPSADASSDEHVPGARSRSRAAHGLAPPPGPRPGGRADAHAPAHHPDFPGHTPLALYQALVGRTRLHHETLRELMAEFEDWLDGMALFFSGPDGA